MRSGYRLLASCAILIVGAVSRAKADLIGWDGDSVPLVDFQAKRGRLQRLSVEGTVSSAWNPVAGKDNLKLMNLTPLSDTLWSAHAGPGPDYETPSDGAEADVAIIGAGYLGLSAAYHLAKSGAKVMVFEAQFPGSGASGRNSGIVVPHFVTSIGPRQAKQKIGNEPGERLSRLVADSGNALFRLIRILDIECDAVQSGWLQPALESSHVPFLERRKADWDEFGKSLEFLGQKRTERLTGIPSYKAALLDPSGGHLNPLALARGLASAALASGVKFWTQAPVTKLERASGTWRVRNDKGRAFAKCVLLATNALDNALAPRMARSLISVTVFQIATKPVATKFRHRILPENHSMTDIRTDIFALRWTRDGRLLTGGVGIPLASPQRNFNFFRRRLVAITGIDDCSEIAFGWNGVISLTRNLMPVVTEVENGMYAAVGCCGRGLALSVALGGELSAFIGSGDSGQLSVETRPARPIAGHRIARHLPALLVSMHRLANWRSAVGIR